MSLNSKLLQDGRREFVKSPLSLPMFNIAGDCHVYILTLNFVAFSLVRGRTFCVSCKYTIMQELHRRI